MKRGSVWACPRESPEPNPPPHHDDVLIKADTFISVIVRGLRGASRRAVKIDGPDASQLTASKIDSIIFSDERVNTSEFDGGLHSTGEAPMVLMYRGCRPVAACNSPSAGRGFESVEDESRPTAAPPTVVHVEREKPRDGFDVGSPIAA